MTPTLALVLETNNLQGGEATAAQTAADLERLLRRLAQQLPRLAELVVTHETLSPPQEADLAAAAGRSIRFLRVPAGTGYYEAKNLGFAATSAEVVAFGDGDCWPDPEWLGRLSEPFAASPATQVVAGRTTYRAGVLGAAASAIDFMYFHPPAVPRLTKNFYANNVAFRREVFAAHGYRAIPGVYRGHCQMLGMRLGAAGVPIHFEPRARTTHRFPDSWRELGSLRRLRGQDTVELTPHLAGAYLPPRLRWLGRSRFAALATLGIRWGYSLRAIGRQDLPALRGLSYLGCIAAMTALSLLDAAGATVRALRPSAGSAPQDGRALSYHQDVDHLGSGRAA